MIFYCQPSKIRHRDLITAMSTRSTRHGNPDRDFQKLSIKSLHRKLKQTNPKERSELTQLEQLLQQTDLGINIIIKGLKGMKNKPLTTCIVIFLCATTITQTASAIRMYEIIDLCPEEERPRISANAINDHGQVVGTKDGNAYIYDEDGLRYIDTFAGTEGQAVDINNAGIVVGYSKYSRYEQYVFVRDITDGTGYTIIDFSTYNRPTRLHINNAGQISGYRDRRGIGDDAFVWDSQCGLILLDPNNVGGSYALSINDNGQIAGNVDGDSYYGSGQACIWDIDYQNESGPVVEIRKLVTPDGFFSRATEINNSGTAAGYIGRIFPIKTTQAVVWESDNTITFLGSLGGDKTEPMSINDRGEVVGWSETGQMYSLSTPQRHAFIRDRERGLIDLNDLIVSDESLSVLEYATDINESGVITARGRKRNLYSSAYLLVPCQMPYQLQRIEILGESIVPQNLESEYLVRAYYENDVVVTFPIATEWSLDSDAAQIAPNGIMRTLPSDVEHLVTISAAYTDESVTCIASKEVRIIPPRVLTVPDEYPTIQSAIDAAYHWDTVLVADGVYRGEGNRDIDFLGKKITVKSSGDASQCIIDCQGTQQEPHRGFAFTSGEQADSILDGFTITGGYIFVEVKSAMRFGTGGGGISCRYSSPAIRNCIISGNTFDHLGHMGPSIDSKGGGGIHCYYSNAIIKNCIIKDNKSSSYGGGICVYYGKPGANDVTIDNCVISSNHAESGGGIYSTNKTTIKNSSIFGNSAENGGGITATGQTIIDNCIVSGNIANDGGGIVLCKEVQIRNCTITGNRAFEHGGGVYHSTSGGATSFSISKGGHSTLITNSILWDNQAEKGKQLGYNGPSVMISGISVIGVGVPETHVSSGSTLEVTGCDIEGDRDGVWFREYDESIEIDWDRILVWGDGNIDVDPAFVDDGYWDDAGTASDPNDDFWVDGDYRLRPDSLCIDAGVECDLNSDITGNARPFDFPMLDNGGVGGGDIGAYEAVVSKEVRFRMIPHAINRQTRRRNVMALISNTGEPLDNVGLLLLPYKIQAQRVYSIKPSQPGGKKHSFAFFDAAKLLDTTDKNGKVELGIVGMTENGEYFYGSDTIQITGKGNKSRQHSKFNRSSKRRGR